MLDTKLYIILIFSNKPSELDTSLILQNGKMKLRGLSAFPTPTALGCSQDEGPGLLLDMLLCAKGQTKETGLAKTLAAAWLKCLPHLKNQEIA